MKDASPHDFFHEQLRHARRLHERGQIPDAVGAYRQLIAMRPQHSKLLFLCGVATLQLGNAGEGVDLLAQSLAIDPAQPHALLNVAIGLRSLERLEESCAALRRALELNPEFAAAHYQRGLALRDLGRVADALWDFERATSLNDAFAEGHNERGCVYRALGRPNEAMTAFARAIELRPAYADAHYHLGLVLQELGRLPEALLSYDRALAADAGLAEAYNNRGRVLRALNRADEAVADFDRAIALDAQFAAAFNNRGVTLTALKRLDEARQSYLRAIELQPGFADAHLNLSLWHLVTGDLAEGFRLYEWRRVGGAPGRCEPPPWLGGEPLAGKIILVRAEQGLGDVIQFCRYVPLLQRSGAQVVLEIPAVLRPLMSTLEGSACLVAAGEPPPVHDLECPIMSLPLAFKTTLQSIPARIPYLSADAKLRSTMHMRLGPRNRPRVGLVWRGAAAHQDDRNRSLELRSLDAILRLPCEFHSLQYQLTAGEAASLAAWPNLRCHPPPLRDFPHTAALMAEMDLILTVDTSAAHLAGALGRPVWILLSHAADFRWLLERTDSPWYPTARLFRQSAPGDWSSAVRAVAEHLAEFIAVTMRSGACLSAT